MVDLGQINLSEGQISEGGMEYGTNREEREVGEEDILSRVIQDDIINRGVIEDRVIEDEIINRGVIEDEINKEMVCEEGIGAEENQISREVIEDEINKEMKHGTDNDVSKEVMSKRIKKKEEEGRGQGEEEDIQTLLQLFNKLEIRKGNDEETDNSIKKEEGAAAISHKEGRKERKEKKESDINKRREYRRNSIKVQKLDGEHG